MHIGYEHTWQAKTPVSEKLHSLFELSAKKHPDHTALVFRNESLTFKELNEKADNLCHAILNWAYYDDVIGVSATPSMDMVVAVLAILKSGKAFMPIDPKASLQRNAQIVSDSNVNFVLAKEQEYETFAGLGLKIIMSDVERNYRTINEKRVGQMAYLMYTSGSTCKPKGVKVEHKAIVHYLQNAIEAYSESELHQSGSFLQLSLTFDAALTSLFVPLLTGKTLVIAESTSSKTFEDKNFKAFAPYDFLKLTPLQFNWLEKAIQNDRQSVCKHLVVGGENLHYRHFAFLHQLQHDTDIINEYGPTETTVGCMMHRISLHQFKEVSALGIPIGKAMKGNEILILNEQMQMIGPGETGEIYIGGPQLSAGYLMRPELNEKLFVTHPFEEDKKLFKTGDKVVINDDGSAIYLDRMENILQHDGQHIDFNQIEWEISQLPGIKQCEVVCKEVKGQNRLLAYILPDDAGLDLESIPQLLSLKLRSEWMPQKFIVLQDWPYTAHGKLNKHALPLPACERHRQTEKRYPKTKIEKQIADIWCQLLKLNEADLDTGFFELGGNHLLADQMLRVLYKKFHYKLDLSTVYRCSSISCLAVELEAQIKQRKVHKVSETKRAAAV